MSWLFGNSLSSDNQESPVGRAGEHIQRWTDPLSWISGGKWADFTSKTLPDATNRVLEPIAKPINEVDQTVNPLRKIPAINNIANLGYSKPGDSIGLAVGSVFSAGALDGALGASGAGGAGAGAGADVGAAGAGAGGSSGGLSGLFGLGGSGAGGTGGATGLTGVFSGPAAYGDAGLTEGVSAGGSNLGAAMGGDLGGSLGSSPTGLFSGSLPGGGMTGTSSGALGGGISGATAGGSNIGGASMGGLFGGSSGSLTNFAQQVLQQQSQLAQQRANQNNQQNQQGNSQNSAGPPPMAIMAPPSYMPSRQAVQTQSPLNSLLGHMLAQQQGISPYGGY